MEIKAAIYGALIALIATTAGYVVSGWQHSQEIKLKQKLFLAEKKYEIFTTYMKSAQRVWTNYESNKKMDWDQNRIRLDSFEEIRLITPTEIQDKANIMNALFGKLDEIYTLTKEDNDIYNQAFNEFKIIARSQFIFE